MLVEGRNYFYDKNMNENDEIFLKVSTENKILEIWINYIYFFLYFNWKQIFALPFKVYMHHLVNIFSSSNWYIENDVNATYEIKYFKK